MGYVKWLGHAAFEAVLGGVRMLFDPWLSGNPAAAVSPESIEPVDLIFVTHDHGDHLGDAVELARRMDATLVSIYEVAQYASSRGAGKVVGMNIGGVAEVEGVQVVMTPALHSSSRGAPAGFIVSAGGESVYHAGDTGFFSDISAYAELYPVDVALLPIGGVYTMDPRQAARFAALVKPRIAVPMHYDTFPAIRQDPDLFKRFVKELDVGIEVAILKPGEKLDF